MSSKRSQVRPAPSSPPSTHASLSSPGDRVSKRVRVVIPQSADPSVRVGGYEDKSKLNTWPDIRTFFGPTTAPLSRDGSSPASSSPQTIVRPSSRSSRTLSSSRQISKNRQVHHISQLLLDISNRPTTQICKDCGMSYVIGVPEDVELHKKYHRRVLEGIEWPCGDYSQADCRVVWRGQVGVEEEKIIKLSLDPQVLKKSKFKIKVDQILQMVNCSLDAQDLTPDQLRASSLYLYIGSPQSAHSSSQPESKKRKVDDLSAKMRKKKLVVKAMCVTARIQQAYQIVRGPDSGDQQADDLCSEDLLRFGETTSELYCSPKAQEALIGIHRIWTSPKHRRSGLAERLLDFVAMTFIYGMPIDQLDARQRLIAFSQPTESGMRLASKWLKTIGFKIFLD